MHTHFLTINDPIIDISIILNIKGPIFIYAAKATKISYVNLLSATFHSFLIFVETRLQTAEMKLYLLITFSIRHHLACSW